MFNTKKFGAYLSRLRKNKDMTQSELADNLNLTRQAISKYEVGESFPDISILIPLAENFGITLDELINSGEPTKGEAEIFNSVSNYNNNVPTAEVADLINLAPLLKPSILDKMAEGLGKQGVDISNIVILAEYLNDESMQILLQNATFDTINDELLQKLIPFLDEKSKNAIMDKILNGELDWHMVKTMLPYISHSQLEAAVIDGALPVEVLDMLHEYTWRDKV